MQIREVPLSELNGHLAEFIRAVERDGDVLLIKRWSEVVAEIRPAETDGSELQRSKPGAATS